MTSPILNLSSEEECSPIQIKQYTYNIVDLINERVPKYILKLIKKIDKFIYLTGNAYTSVNSQVFDILTDWFLDHHIVLNKKIKFINQTKLTPINSIIETVPSYSTQKKRDIYIVAFPMTDILETQFAWSERIRSLNLYLKNYPQTTETIIDTLNSLNYKFDRIQRNQMSNLQIPLNSGIEIYFSDPYDSWIYFSSTEINKKLFNRLFNSLV